MTTSQNGSITAVITDQAAGVYNYAQNSLDRVVSPSTRQEAYDRSSTLASTRPILFSFVAAQLLFALLPLAGFATFVISIFTIAVGGAVLFILFWIGVALLVLVPCLLVTFTLALFTWSWAVSCFLIGKWLYERVPTVQSNIQIKVDTTKNKLDAVKLEDDKVTVIDKRS